MSFQAPVSGPVARSLPKDVIRVRQVPAGVAGIKQNVISNCASALRRSRLRIGAVRSRARKQAVVAQTITSPCLETILYVVNRRDRLLIKPDILTRSRQGQIVPWRICSARCSEARMDNERMVIVGFCQPHVTKAEASTTYRFLISWL